MLIGTKSGKVFGQQRLFFNMLLKNETNSSTMIGILDVIKQELKKIPYNFHGQKISSRAEFEKEVLDKDPYFVVSRSRSRI